MPHKGLNKEAAHLKIKEMVMLLMKKIKKHLFNIILEQIYSGGSPI
jgi:hypothetical protein